MKISIKEFLLINSILFVGLYYLAFLIEGWTSVYLFIAVGVIGVILIIATLFGIFRILTAKNKKILIGIGASILAIVIVTFQPIERIIEELKSPVVLYGYCEHTMTSLSLKLREDKSFEYNAGAFLSREMYHGSYSLSNDTITLYFKDTIPDNVNNKLILEKDWVYELGDTLEHTHAFKTTINNLK